MHILVNGLKCTVCASYGHAEEKLSEPEDGSTDNYDIKVLMWAISERKVGL